MEVGGCFVRIRPALAPEDAARLEQLAATAREFADQLDAFRDNFVVVPPGANQTVEPVVSPLRLVTRPAALPEGEPAA